MSQVCTLNSALQRIAREELNEVERRISDDIATLRKWIELQPHLNARTDDQFLLAFLRGSKHSLEKAKSKLEHFYTIKTLLPEIFDVNTKDIGLLRASLYVGLPKPLGADGPRIHLTICKNLDLAKYSLIDLIRYERMVIESQVFHDDNCIISGFIEIIDVEKVGIKFFQNFDFVLLKKLCVLVEKGIPMRLNSLHIVNFPKEAVPFVNFGRSLCSEKMKKRFLVHKSFDELYKFVPRVYLPIEYGGENGSIAEIQAEAEQIIMAHDFEQDKKYGINEAMRPKGTINRDSLFGIEGTFRKLDFD